MAETGATADENNDGLWSEVPWIELMLLEWVKKLSGWAVGIGSGVVGGFFNSAMALAMRLRLPKATIPISLLSSSRSNSRRTSPVISCSMNLSQVLWSMPFPFSQSTTSSTVHSSVGLDGGDDGEAGFSRRGVSIDRGRMGDRGLVGVSRACWIPIEVAEEEGVPNG